MSQENGRWRDKPIKPHFTRRAALKNQIKELRAASQEEDRAQEVIGRYRRPKKQRRYDADLEVFRDLSAKDRDGVLYRSFWGNREHFGSRDDPDALVRHKHRPNGDTWKVQKWTTGPDGKPKSYVARQIKLRGRKLTDREFDEKGRLVRKTKERFPHYKEVWERDTNGNLIQTELRRGSLNVTLSGVDEHGKRKKTVQRGKRIDVFERDEATGALTQLSSTGHRFRSNIETTISGDRRTSSTTVKQLGRRARRYRSELDESGDEIGRQELKRQGFFTRNDDSRRSFTSAKKTTLLGNDHVRVETPGFGKPQVKIREAKDGERTYLDRPSDYGWHDSNVSTSTRFNVAGPSVPARTELRSPVATRDGPPDNVDVNAVRALAGLNSPAAPPVVSVQPPPNGSRGSASTRSNVAVPSAPARAQLRSPVATRDGPPDNVDVNAFRALAGLNSSAVSSVVDRSRGTGRVPPSPPAAVGARPNPAIVGGETAGSRRVAAAPPQVSDKPSAGDQSASREWTMDELMADLEQTSQGDSTSQSSSQKQPSVNQAKGVAARQFSDRVPGRGVDRSSFGI
ncbi:hypothetical protein [Ensifer sp. NM-2]|uniref:hypothetical protein n=1 Tax=Ensifer sp. NM-2 TaxID=2109730 RepID=UPI0011B28E1A|nr:hypothetical protein [Ensifer sp. NM-2]